MYLERLPRENNESKLILNISGNNHYIDVTLSIDLFDAVTPEVWLKGFQEHYNFSKGIVNDSPIHIDFPENTKNMYIPEIDTQINFEVDSEHKALKIRVKDEKASDIVYGFLERIIQ